MAELAEVLASEAVQRGAVELRLAADVVVDPGLECLAALVVPGIRRHVPVLDEDLFGVPVLDLARQPVATLEDQDPLARRREVTGERPAACAAADDDHVVRSGLGHRYIPSSIGRTVSCRPIDMPRIGGQSWPLPNAAVDARSARTGRCRRGPIGRRTVRRPRTDRGKLRRIDDRLIAPVDPRGVAAIEHLRAPTRAEVVPAPVDE